LTIISMAMNRPITQKADDGHWDHDHESQQDGDQPTHPWPPPARHIPELECHDDAQRTCRKECGGSSCCHTSARVGHGSEGGAAEGVGV